MGEPLSDEELREVLASVTQGILPPGLNVLRLLATIDARDAEIARLNDVMALCDEEIENHISAVVEKNAEIARLRRVVHEATVQARRFAAEHERVERGGLFFCATCSAARGSYPVVWENCAPAAMLALLRWIPGVLDHNRTEGGDVDG